MYISYGNANRPIKIFLKTFIYKKRK